MMLMIPAKIIIITLIISSNIPLYLSCCSVAGIVRPAILELFFYRKSGPFGSEKCHRPGIQTRPKSFACQAPSALQTLTSQPTLQPNVRKAATAGATELLRVGRERGRVCTLQ